MSWTPITVGIIVGIMASVLQAFFHIIPPPAYGLCIACHMRDLVNWIVVHFYPFYGVKANTLIIPVAPVSYHIPVLTIVGILIGAHIAARLNKEFRWKKMNIWWQKPAIEFLWGMAVMISALTMGGCPIRTALKSAYLDLTAIVGLVMIFIGVIVGCKVIRKIV